MCCSGMGNGSRIFSGHTNAGNRSSHYWWIISWSTLTLRSNTHTQVLQELPLDYHQSLFLSRPSFGQSLSNCCMRSVGCRIFHFMTSVCYLQSVLSDKSWSYTIGVFDDDFMDRLFDLVEQTRSMQDDTFNYSVIKLIVCFLVELVPRWLLRTWSDLTEWAIHGRLPPFWLSTLW